MNRRQFIHGAASTSVLALSGCSTATKVGQSVEELPTTQNSSNIMTMYGSMPEERFPLPAIEISKVPSKFRRRQVNFTSPYPVGTVIVDTMTYYLRALYIFQNGKDTLYRIHGSPEYWTIGKSVSSGCVRMINQDVVDLYGRATSGARLIVI